MNSLPDSFDSGLEIRRPCPKRWAELRGDDRRRFCSECSLHVHNAAALSRDEVRDLVSSGESRVCLRVEFDARGRPLFRDSDRTVAAPRRTLASRARWVMSAFAGLLAACTGGVETCAPPPATNVEAERARMGQVVEKVGDFAPPVERLGEAVAVPTPEPGPEDDAR